MQLLTNCLLSLFSLIFLLHLSLSSPSSSSSHGSSENLLHGSFAEKTCSISTGPPIWEGLLDPLSCDAARTGQDKMATVAEQKMAMEALKYSLGIPDKMHWNNDPCLPTSWEGVKCGPADPLGSGLVILEIDLSNQGLTGFIAEEIRLLTNLNSLNLSNNHLTGPIPTNVYSIHLRGGKTNFSDNEHLCGVGLPNTRQCSPFMIMMMSTTKKVVLLLIVLIGVGYACINVFVIRDADDPLIGIVFPEVKYRVFLALSCGLFDMLRISVMDRLINIPDFDMRLAYYKWHLGVAADVLHGLAFGSFLSALFIIVLRKSSRSGSMVILLSIQLTMLGNSARTMQNCYQHPWLMILEMVWGILIYVFTCFLIRLPLTINLRIWVHNVRMVVLPVIQLLRWYDYIGLAIFMYNVLELIYTVMTP